MTLPRGSEHRQWLVISTWAVRLCVALTFLAGMTWGLLLAILVVT